LNNAYARASQNAQRSLADHYRDLVSESRHQFQVLTELPLAQEKDKP
jgi:hypothetical protein